MMTFKAPKITASRAVLEKVSPPPKILVELGTYVGNSAVVWGAMLRDLNEGKTDDVKVYCCEFDEEYVKICQRHDCIGGRP